LQILRVASTVIVLEDVRAGIREGDIAPDMYTIPILPGRQAHCLDFLIDGPVC
jgi:hypothetical protein